MLHSTRILVLALLLAALYIFGCSQAATDVSVLSPNELVETYYQSLAAGDSATARACLAEDYASELDKVTCADCVQNLKSVKNIVVKGGTRTVPVHFQGAMIDAIQVTAEYEANYRKMITALDGKQHRFVYVAQVDDGPSWKIISIGTGP